MSSQESRCLLKLLTDTTIQVREVTCFPLLAIINWTISSPSKESKMSDTQLMKRNKMLIKLQGHPQKFMKFQLQWSCHKGLSRRPLSCQSHPHLLAWCVFPQGPRRLPLYSRLRISPVHLSTVLLSRHSTSNLLYTATCRHTLPMGHHRCILKLSLPSFPRNCTLLVLPHPSL